MKKTIIMAAVVCLLSGACTARSLELPEPPAAASAPKTDPLCYDPQALAKALHLEDIHTEQDGPEAAAELLESLGVELLQEKGLKLVSAKRISGQCVEHLEHVKAATYRFNTGVILDRDDGVFTPYSRGDYPWYFISSDEEHPERATYHFVKAVELDTGSVRYRNWASRFIGVWDQDGTSVVAPYRKNPHEEFVVYDDLIASRQKISDLSFWPNLHQTPGGYMQILLQNGDDRIVLAFNWWYRGLSIENRQ